MLVKFVTTVKANRAAAWAFVADFSNIGAWDPGVKAAKKARAHLPRARDGRQKRLDSFHKSHILWSHLPCRPAQARRAWAPRTT